MCANSSNAASRQVSSSAPIAVSTDGRSCSALARQEPLVAREGGGPVDVGLGVPLALLAALVEGAQLLDLAARTFHVQWRSSGTSTSSLARAAPRCAPRRSRRPRSRRASGGTPRGSSPWAPLLSAIVLVTCGPAGLGHEAEAQELPELVLAAADLGRVEDVLAQHLGAEVARGEGEDGQCRPASSSRCWTLATRKTPGAHALAQQRARARHDAAAMARCPSISSGRSPGEVVVLEERAQEEARVASGSRRARRPRSSSQRSRRSTGVAAAGQRAHQRAPRCGRGCAPRPRRRAAACSGSGGRATTSRARPPRRPRARPTPA